LLDFSIVARGYSLSLAFFVWALYFSMERRYLAAGVLLGLSLASNIAILFPILALIVAIALLDRGIKPLLNLALPALLLGALFTYPSLRRAQKEDFYTGYPDFRWATTSFIYTSFHAIPDRMGIMGGRTAAENIGIVGLPVFLLALAGTSFFVKDRRQLISFLVFTITIFGLIVAHWMFKVNYPSDRTCLYFVVLAAVSWAVAGDVFKSRLVVQAVWTIPAILLLIQFSSQLQMQYFQFWRVETDDQRMAELIQKASAGKPENSLTVGSSWMHQPALEFYRQYLHITALKPVERYDPIPLTGFDFYVLSWGDVERAKQANLRTVFADPYAEVVLAVPPADN
jgi:hypothetical protein